MSSHAGSDSRPTFLIPLIVAIVGVMIVAAGGVVLANSAFDKPVNVALHVLHKGMLGNLGDLVYKGFGPVPAVLGTAAITLILLLVRRDLRFASTFAVTIAVTWLSSGVVKLAVNRPRPGLSPLATGHDPSYPSGHMVFMTAVIVTAYLLTSSMRGRVLWAVLGGAFLTIFAFVLISDGVHFPTDVIASAVWGVTVAPLVRVLWDRLSGGRLDRLSDAWNARRSRAK